MIENVISSFNKTVVNLRIYYFKGRTTRYQIGNILPFSEIPDIAYLFHITLIWEKISHNFIHYLMKSDKEKN